MKKPKKGKPRQPKPKKRDAKQGKEKPVVRSSEPSPAPPGSGYRYAVKIPKSILSPQEFRPMQASARGRLGNAWTDLMAETSELSARFGINPLHSAERRPFIAALETIPVNAQPAQALRLIRAIINNSRSMEDFSPAQVQRLVVHIHRWVTLQFLAELPWDFVVVLCDKLVYALLAYGTERTEADWELAEKCARFALSLMERYAPDDIHLPDAMDILGTVLLNRRNINRVPRLREAEVLFKRNLEVAPRLGASHQHKRALLNLGILNQELARQEPGRIFRAIEFYDALERLNREHEPEEGMLGLLLTNRAWALIELPRDHQPEGVWRAISDAENAVSLYRRERGRRAGLAWALMYLGLAQCQLDQYEHAQHEAVLRNLGEAQALFRELRIADGYSRVVHNLGLHWMQVGDPRKALGYYQEALKFRQGRAIEEWETLGNIVDVRIPPGMPAFGSEGGDEYLLERLDTLSQQLSSHGDADRALRAHYYGLQLLGRTPSDAADDDIFRWAERAVSQAESVWAATASTPLVRYHLGRWLGTFYAARLLLGIRREESVDVLLGFAQSGKARTLILDRQSGSAAHPSAVDGAALRKRLQQTPGTAFIEIGVSSLGTAVLVASLDREGALEVHRHLLALSEEAVVGLLTKPDKGWQWHIEALRRADGDGQLDALEACVAAMERILGILHTELLGPVTAGLRSRGVQDLVFSVHGPLAALPLAAAWRLVEGEPRYLIEDFRSISLSPSVATFVYGEEPRPISVCRYVVGDTPNLAKEAGRDGHALESIWRHSAQTLSAQKDPSPEEFLQSLDRADLVHAVCHGEFNAWQLDKSGIHVGGSALLSCEQLLADPSLKRAAVVVLCACRSGRSRQEDFGAEWLGLLGVLLRRGVQSVLAALWDVDYDASFRLSCAFYEQLFRGNQPAAIAASTAMRQMLDAGRAAKQSEAAHWFLARHPLALRPRLRRLLDSPWLWACMQLVSVSFRS